MPTYEFYCAKCKLTFEKVMSILAVRERKETTCGKCKRRANQIISGGGSVHVQGGTPKFHNAEQTQRSWNGSPEQRRELAAQRAAVKRKDTRKFFKDGKLKPFWHEDLGSKPVYIHNSKQYRQELRKRGLANPSVGEYGQSH